MSGKKVKLNATRSIAAKNPRFCTRHPEGTLTQEFIDHLPQCSMCTRVMKHLNRLSGKDERERLLNMKKSQKT
jgi:hypothetical protein